MREIWIGDNFGDLVGCGLFTGEGLMIEDVWTHTQLQGGYITK